jgi:uncharacterized coiled-coil DUF342 family protein
MNEMQFLGYLISAIITLGGFIAIIMKFIQPINDLRLVIQKLNDSIDNMRKDDEDRDKRITKHGEQIDELKSKVNGIDNKVENLRVKVEMYHDK